MRGSENGSAPVQTLRIRPQDSPGNEQPSAVALRVSACFEELHGPVCGYLLTLCRRPEEAEEIMQESFLRLYSHLTGGHQLQNPKAWLFRVSHNLAINHMKRIGPVQGVGLAFDGKEEYAEPVAPEPDPEQRMLEKERSTSLRTAIGNLTVHQRRCLYLRAEGLRYREIAEMLGITISSVVDNLARTVERLRKTSED